MAILDEVHGFIATILLESGQVAEELKPQAGCEETYNPAEELQILLVIPRGLILKAETSVTFHKANYNELRWTKSVQA
ncbi:hypothetical protein ACHAPY_010827, partial [Fusarium culmorum]